MMWSRILVVVVSHHSRAWAAPLGRALAAAPSVVVVDNASTDGSADAFAAALPHADVVRLGVNVGFGAAHNLGAARGFKRWPHCEFVLLLNPDCELSTAALSSLIAVLDAQPQVGVVSPQLMNADQSPQPTARQAFFRPRRGAPSSPPTTGPHEWLCGACLLVRRTAWQAVAGFDARYFLFYEDDDLCLRLQAAGWQCWLESSARAVHLAGTGTAFSWSRWWVKNFHQARSKRLALATWDSAAAAWRYRVKLALVSLVAVPFFTLLLRPRLAVKWAAWGTSALAATDRPWRSTPV